MGVIRGGTRSLDYSSCGPTVQALWSCGENALDSGCGLSAGCLLCAGGHGGAPHDGGRF